MQAPPDSTRVGCRAHLARRKGASPHYVKRLVRHGPAGRLHRRVASGGGWEQDLALAPRYERTQHVGVLPESAARGSKPVLGRSPACIRRGMCRNKQPLFALVAPLD